jgi:hypothetical protein
MKGEIPSGSIVGGAIHNMQKVAEDRLGSQPSKEDLGKSGRTNHSSRGSKIGKTV